MKLYFVCIALLTFSGQVWAIQQRRGGSRMPLAFSPPRGNGPTASAALLQTPLRLETETQPDVAGTLLESATSEAIASAQATLGNTTLPTVPEEKESRAREESSFLTDILTPSAETFAAVNPAEKEAEANSDVHHFQQEVLSAFQEEGAKDAEGTKVRVNPLSQHLHLDSVPAYIFSPVVSEACRQDFSQPCPNNFSLQNSLCIALDSYTGPCARVQKEVPVLNEEQKEAWARVCEAEFPCVPASCPVGTDYEEDCPVGWKLSAADGFCHENQIATPLCEEPIRGDASPVEKAAFEKRCRRARWPCLKGLSCLEKNYGALCPQGWFLQAGSATCTPPTTYTGPCRSISARDFGVARKEGGGDRGQKAGITQSPQATERALLTDSAAGKTPGNFQQAKMVVEKKCSVSWPCKPQHFAQHRDFSAPCPLGWTHLRDESCEAPPDFIETPNCPRTICNLSRAAKAALSIMCHVDYPFKRRGRCKRDFSSRCPINWRDLGDGRRCRAPDDYAGRCDSVSDFSNLSDEQKMDKLEECGLQWPFTGRRCDSRHFSGEGYPYRRGRKDI